MSNLQDKLTRLLAVGIGMDQNHTFMDMRRPLQPGPNTLSMARDMLEKHVSEETRMRSFDQSWKRLHPLAQQVLRDGFQAVVKMSEREPLRYMLDPEFHGAVDLAKQLLERTKP